MLTRTNHGLAWGRPINISGGQNSLRTAYRTRNKAIIHHNVSEENRANICHFKFIIDDITDGRIFRNVSRLYDRNPRRNLWRPRGIDTVLEEPRIIAARCIVACVFISDKGRCATNSQNIRKNIVWKIEPTCTRFRCALISETIFSIRDLGCTRQISALNIIRAKIRQARHRKSVHFKRHIFKIKVSRTRISIANGQTRVTLYNRPPKI